MVDWQECTTDRGEWRFFHLGSLNEQNSRLVAYTPYVENPPPELVIGWSAACTLNYLAYTTSNLILDLSRFYPSARWSLTLTGYGSRRVVHELLGAPGKLGVDTWAILQPGARQPENVKSEDTSPRVILMDDLPGEFLKLRDEAAPTSKPVSNLAIRADARAELAGEPTIAISIWGRPDIDVEASLSMPYGNLSIKGTPSSIQSVEDNIAQSISSTIIGGADLIETREVVRLSIHLANPPARAAA